MEINVSEKLQVNKPLKHGMNVQWCLNSSQIVQIVKYNIEKKQNEYISYVKKPPFVQGSKIPKV